MKGIVILSYVAAVLDEIYLYNISSLEERKAIENLKFHNLLLVRVIMAVE